MEISLSKLITVVTGIVVAGLIGYTGYFMYLLFFTGPQIEEAPPLTRISTGILGPKMRVAATAVSDPIHKITLNRQKNLQFLDTPLYKSFTEIPDSVPLSGSRGRPDPFVPYVAP